MVWLYLDLENKFHWLLQMLKGVLGDIQNLTRNNVRYQVGAFISRQQQTFS